MPAPSGKSGLISGQTPKTAARAARTTSGRRTPASGYENVLQDTGYCAVPARLFGEWDVLDYRLFEGSTILHYDYGMVCL